MRVPASQDIEREPSVADLHEGSEAEAALRVCRKLRTKMAFLPLRDQDNQALYWQRGDGGTAVYWCLRTMECAGPDGGLAHATLCCGDRECCEPVTS